MLRKGVGALVAAGVLLSVTACGSSSGGGGGDGTLTIGVGIIPTSLNPARAYYSDQRIMALAVGTLTTVQPGDDQPSMQLAESVTPTDGGYVVNLKPGLEFSDGSPLTAEDVVASLKRDVADEASGNVGAAGITNVAASDELTVDIELKRPYSALPSDLALLDFGIWPSEAIEDRGSDNLFDGDPLPTAGQYTVESLDDSQITLEANPQYAGSKPSTDTLIFKRIDDTSARLAQLQSGQLDYADTLSPQNADGLGSPLEARTAIKDESAILLLMNTRKNSVLGDVRVRQAISVAVDREQVNEVAYAGLSEPATGLGGADSAFGAGSLPETADVDRAKDLLADTRCENGCQLTFVVSSTRQQYVDASLVIQQSLKAIGMNVKIEQAEDAAVTERQANGDFDLGIAGNFGVSPFGYANTTLGQDGYFADRVAYHSNEMNALLDRMASATGDEIAALGHQIADLLEDDVPMTPLVKYMLASGSRVPSKTFDINGGFWFLYQVG